MDLFYNGAGWSAPLFFSKYEEVLGTGSFSPALRNEGCYRIEASVPEVGTEDRLLEFVLQWGGVVSPALLFKIEEILGAGSSSPALRNEGCYIIESSVPEAGTEDRPLHFGWLLGGVVSPALFLNRGNLGRRELIIGAQVVG